MAELTEKVGNFEADLINTDDAGINEEMVQPIGIDNNEIVDSTQDVSAHDQVSGPEPLQNAEVYLPHRDRNEIAKIIGRKRTADGLYVGRKLHNPMLDSRKFVVEFPDGDQKDVAYNVIAEHLYSQIDSEGNKQYQLFKDIVNHRKNKTAVEKSDQFRIDRRTGRQDKKKTTAGWDLEIEWKDGSTSWIPLKELKETNGVQVAKYAVDNQIDDEPAFDWWVRGLLKKQKRLIK